MHHQPDDTRPRPHESAAAHVSGRAMYTDDQRLLAGMLSAYPVMSPYARARIVRLETSPAYDVPGVVTVLTAADVPGINDSNPHAHDEILLPEDELHFWGQPAAWVLAENDEAARLGAERVELDCEAQEPLLSIDQAIAAESFHGQPMLMKRGNPQAALSLAPHLLSGEVRMNGQDHFYLETQASWALPDSEGNMQVYASTQHPSETQACVAAVLGWPSSRVVVTCLRMGGGFGGKETQANPYAAIAALGAYKTGRPVRVRLKRDHDMIMTGKRHGFLGRYQLGFDEQGTLLALDLELYSDGGWSSDLSLPVLQRAMFHSDNSYFIPDMQVRGQVCRTNKVSNTAFRGFGGPQGMVVIEDIVDRVARHLGLLPETVRARNFYREGQSSHYGQQIVDNRLPRIWQELETQAAPQARREAIAAFNAAHPHCKRGMALTPVKFGISFTNTPLNQAGALLLIYVDGSIQLNHGGTEMGQGLHSKMLAVASRALGVKVARFRMMPTSTDKVPNTSATAASSGADLNGQAVKQACETLKARLAQVAAKLLRLNAPEDLVFADDWIYAAGQPSDRVGFDAVVQQAYLEQISLSATGYYRTPNIYFDKLKSQGRPFYYYAYGAALSEVEVDGFTGCYRLRRVDIIHDVGESLHAPIDRGQIEGGFVQGMGWLTMEELVWDDQGRLRTHAPSTYKIPTIGEVPEAFHLSLLERAPQPGVIYGSKAVGEPPFMLAISVREAIRDAIAAFVPGVQQVPLLSPATPEVVLRTLEQLTAAARPAREVAELS